MTPDRPINRFVVLHHTVAAALDRTTESHFDWMFERRGSLRTFATSVIESLACGTSGFGFKLPNTVTEMPDVVTEMPDAVTEMPDAVTEMPDAVTEIDAQQLPDHRTQYLDYQGPISGGRGQVQRVIAGTFECCKDNENEFVAQIMWQHQGGTWQTEIAFYRKLSDDLRFNDKLDAWRLRLAPWSYETN